MHNHQSAIQHAGFLSTKDGRGNEENIAYALSTDERLALYEFDTNIEEDKGEDINSDVTSKDTSERNDDEIKVKQIITASDEMNEINQEKSNSGVIADFGDIRDKLECQYVVNMWSLREGGLGTGVGGSGAVVMVGDTKYAFSFFFFP